MKVVDQWNVKNFVFIWRFLAIAVVLHRVRAYCKQWTNYEPISSHFTSAHKTNEMLRVTSYLIWRFSVDLRTTLYFTAVPFVNKTMVKNFKTVFRPGQSKTGINIDTFFLSFSFLVHTDLHIVYIYSPLSHNVVSKRKYTTQWKSFNLKTWDKVCKKEPWIPFVILFLLQIIQFLIHSSNAKAFQFLTILKANRIFFVFCRQKILLW